MGEGSPQSNAMTEGDYVPDSPASSPIELKQELPKYLPALQVGDHLKDAWKSYMQMGFVNMGNVFTVAFMHELMGRICLVDSLLQSTHLCVKYVHLSLNSNCSCEVA